MAPFLYLKGTEMTIKTSLDADIAENLQAQESVKKQILEATKELQDELSRLENQWASLSGQRDALIMEQMRNPDIHILERFNIWRNMCESEETAPFILNRGAYRDNVLEEIEYYRYETVDVIDSICMWHEYIQEWKTEDDFSIFKTSEENKAKFDAMPDESYKTYVAILEDVIDQNTKYFKYDW